MLSLCAISGRAGTFCGPSVRSLAGLSKAGLGVRVAISSQVACSSQFIPFAIAGFRAVARDL